MIGLKSLLREGLSELEFYGDLVLVGEPEIQNWKKVAGK